MPPFGPVFPADVDDSQCEQLLTLHWRVVPAEQKAFGAGNDDNFYLDPGSEPLRGLLQFDLSSIPLPVTISNATLTLEFAGGSGSQTTPLTMRFDPLQSSWSEGSVTWNNRPNLDTANGVVGTFPLSGFNPNYLHLADWNGISEQSL